MPAPFNIVGIDHVVLRAADPTKLERFYLDALGLTFEKRQGELAQLRAGNALIDIVPADEAGPAGGTSSTGGANLDHLCLRIEPFDQAAITGCPQSSECCPPSVGILSALRRIPHLAADRIRGLQDQSYVESHILHRQLSNHSCETASIDAR
jgi:catechol 2,3-dioxygenase-like lactoylglutathione lyase family enzyme